MGQTWKDDSYGEQQAYDNQYPEQAYQQDYAPRAESRRSGPLTVALIAGVLACSCLSCLIGAGLGLVAWEEINTAPGTGAAEQVAPPGARARSSWQSADVVNAFVAAGLECKDPRSFSIGEDTPFLVAEATRCSIPSACEKCTARIYSFDDQAELGKARKYYVDLGDQDPALFSWIYVKDNILVQLNGKLPEEQAQLYRQALIDM